MRDKIEKKRSKKKKKGKKENPNSQIIPTIKRMGKKFPWFILENIEKNPKIEKTNPLKKADFSGDPLLSSFKKIVAVLLSSRTKDETTLKAHRKLFANIKTFQDFSKLTSEEIEEKIYGVGFYKIKAKRISAIYSILKTKGIPKNIEKLPGIGEKSASLLRNFLFQQPDICVDTHVHRITNRWGIFTKNPQETKEKLKEVLPKKFWNINHTLVRFGRSICGPKPKCEKCTIQEKCYYFTSRKLFEKIITKYKFKEIKIEEIMKEIEKKGKKSNKKNTQNTNLEKINYKTYILQITLNDPKTIKTRTKIFKLPSGIYFYVGSNKKGNRLKRHLQTKKTEFWHIDFLLKHANIQKIYINKIPLEEKCAEEMEKFLYVKGF